MLYKVACKLEDNSYVSAIINGDRYQLKYNMDEITKALDNTLGVFCFDNINSAKIFVKECVRDKAFGDVVILEVEGIGKGKTPRELSIYRDDRDLDYFYNSMKNSYAIGRMQGLFYDIVCYPSVKVIRECFVMSKVRFKWEVFCDDPIK